MDISVFQIIAIVFFILAFVFLAISIAVFFTQDIASVIGFFSGKTARKQIEQIRNQTTNINYGAKSKASNAYDSVINQSVPQAFAFTNSEASADAHPSKNLGRKARAVVDAPVIKTTTPATDGGTVSLDSYNESSADIPTSQLNQNELSQDDIPTGVLSDNVPTDVLSSDDIQTDILSDNIPTALLSEDDVPTGVLSEDELGTTVLSNDNILVADLSKDEVLEGFEILEDVSFADTDEVIK